MARHSADKFKGTATLTPAEHERTLFSRVCDAIGTSAAYVAHDVMPDIRARLIDEGWFGRPAYPAHGHGQEAGAPWRTSTLTIDGELTRSDAPSQAPDRGIER